MECKGGSPRYITQKYQKQVDNYTECGSTELGNLVLTGDELLDLVDAIENMDNYYEEYEEIKEKYGKLEESHQKLINNIEFLFKGKEEGSLVRKVRVLLDEAKEKSEE